MKDNHLLKKAVIAAAAFVIILALHAACNQLADKDMADYKLIALDVVETYPPAAQNTPYSTSTPLEQPNNSLTVENVIIGAQEAEDGHKVEALKVSVKTKKVKKKKAKKAKKKRKSKKKKKATTVTYKVTAYCPCRSCSGSYGGTTSTGVKATAGRTVAVDPTVIPYGTRLKINGHVYVAEDCGGAVKGRHIDMFFNSHSEALKWGVRYCDVEILKK